MKTGISHFTAIEVTENGAEATAFTVTVSYTSAPIVPKLAEFIADRPFAYFIIEAETQSMLMADVVTDPTK